MICMWAKILSFNFSAVLVFSQGQANRQDRPSNYGYIQQAHSYLEADP